MNESWSELRCPACVSLGYTRYKPLVLFKIYGRTYPQQSPVFIQVKCWHCKSLISWEFGTTNIKIDEYGKPYKKQEDDLLPQRKQPEPGRNYKEYKENRN